MPYDYSKLDGKIKEICGTQSRFAKDMGLSERSVSLKMNGRVPWSQPEMQKAADILHIPLPELQDYFFKIKVQ